MPDGATLALKTADPIVYRVSERIAAIAVGNPLDRKDMTFDGTRTDRPLTLTMKVALRASPETNRTKGAHHPKESLHCDGEATAVSRVEAACRAALADPKLSEKLGGLIGADREGRFAKLEDGFAIQAPVTRCHWHSPCGTCGRTGSLSCRPCFGRGSVSCTSCSDGKASCTSCGGRGSEDYTESVWNDTWKSYEQRTRSRSCGRCRGSGRWGNCYTCVGSRQVTCRHCGGEGRVDCGDCGATGWFTITKASRIAGYPERAVSFPSGTPASFAEQVRRLPVKDLLGKHLDAKGSDLRVEMAVVTLAFECSMPQVSVTARFDTLLEQQFEAFGKTGWIGVMPHFLDRLLASIGDDIELAVDKGDIRRALETARTTRLSTAVLQAAAEPGGGAIEKIAERIVESHEQAASGYFVERMLERLVRAYDGLGRIAVRRTWLRLGSLSLAAAFAIPYFGAADALVARFPVLAGTAAVVPSGGRVEGADVLAVAVALVPTLLVAPIAGRRARRAVRAVIGDDAKRAPRQGRWRAIGLSLAFVAALVGQGFATSQYGDVPPVFPQPKRAQLQAASPRRRAAQTAVLSPSQLPARVQPPPLVEGPGHSTLPEIKRGLTELGFFTGPIDGRLTSATQVSMRSFLSHVPPSESSQLGRIGVLGMVSAALRDDGVRLERLPADGFVTAKLSNVTRASLTRDDMNRLLAAAGSARRAPGKEFTWRSGDGLRGGRVISAPGDATCATFDVEVRTLGAVERTGPTVFCHPG